jgi:nanoRNase/pAp phosphatase (c-di-AMP/oligoRNAs hydrolase)|tara:strand:- start:247 stop:627 length:381 start_codon:yes stop_codon:yes gene_type:complete
MSNKPLNIGDEARVQMPMKTVASLIVLVAMGVFAYTEVTARLTSLETSRELFNADLLKKSEQKPTDQEQFMLIEALFEDVEKLIKNQEQNMTNKVNIEFLKTQLEKALDDVEELKDKVRQNGNGHQ